MVITYETYKKLEADIMEYAAKRNIKRLTYPEVVQAEIYVHYMNKYGSIIAVNSKGNKELFRIVPQHQKSERKKQKKRFKLFMKE